MYHPYQNMMNSFYFYPFAYPHPYFNYTSDQNNLKISSNLILIDTENQTTFNIFQQEKIQETQSTLESSIRPNKIQNEGLIRSSTNKQIKENLNIVKKQKKVKKTPRRNEIVQKEGRNSHSNILRKFFKMIFVETEIQPIIEKIIQKFQLEIDPAQFFAEIKLKDIDHRNYIRVKEVDWIFEFTENHVNKIVRILFEHYLRNYYIEHLLSSKKTNNKSVGYHLQGRRNICEEIIEEGLKK